MRPLFDVESLENALTGGALVLTPNLRLARKIREAWGLRRQGAGERVWRAPRVLALDAWIQDCWLSLVDAAYAPALTGIPARPFQETLVWEQAIAGDEKFPPESRADRYADLARQGWQLARQWRLDGGQLAASHHDGAQSLARWAATAENTLAERGLLTSARRAEIVASGFRDGILPTVPRIVLVAFQTLSPLYRDLLELAGQRVESHEAGRSHRSSAAQPRSLARAVAEDSAAELAAAASWARDRAAADPDARIGVVVANLAGARDTVERHFRHCLDPGWCLPNQRYRPPPFNISAGVPLSRAGLVAAALDLLALNLRRLPVEDLCRLLDNPFWGDAPREARQRSLAAHRLLDKGHPALSPAHLRGVLAAMAEDIPDPGAPHQRLTAMETLRRDSLRRARGGRLDHRGWREVFSAQLETLGWPGNRPLDSLEYQHQDHWRDLLDQFVAFDRVSGPVTLETALARLGKLAADTVFQAETPDSQIQVLGSLEAAGLRFDHLWITGMDDRQWPQPVAPHPLLPVPLQQDLGMPRASADRESRLSEALFRQFATSAGEVVCSYAARDGDSGREPAALIRHLPEVPVAGEGPHPWTRAIARSQTLETIDDSRAPALDTGREPVRGGSRLLEDQARCPFNAFAIWRLGATPLPTPVIGLDPRVRGNLVHEALEYFWTGLSGSDELAALDDETRQARVRDAVARACAPLHRDDYSARYLALEENRLGRLLGEWLEKVELHRQPFQVLSTEQSLGLEIAGLHLRLRIDRTDQLADGRRVLIDYKTGNAGIGTLADDRLVDPQLPLYALASPGPLAAVGYGKVRTKGVTFTGLTDSDAPLPGSQPLVRKGLPDTWESTLDLWNNSLICIANEFLSGNASLVFYGADSARRYSHLQVLNRWPEHGIPTTPAIVEAP